MGASLPSLLVRPGEKMDDRNARGPDVAAMGC
jgi:hypothetical protein